MPESETDPGRRHAPGKGQASGPGRPSRRRSAPPAQSDDPVLQVRLVAPSPQAFVTAVDGVPVDFGCAGPRVHSPGGEVTANVQITASALQSLRERSSLVRADVLGDLSESLAQRREQVGTGNRFADPGVLPQGLGSLIREEKP